MESPSYLAGATIYPMTFIQEVTNPNTPFTAIPAGATGIPVGVADHRVCGLPGSTGFQAANVPLPAANTGDPIRVYGEGEAALIISGAAITAGTYLKPDANSCGIQLDKSGGTTAVQWYGARAEEFANASGVPIRCTVLLGAYTYHS